MENKNLSKLFLMVIVLPKNKKEIFGDMLERYDVTAYVSTLARGAQNASSSKELMFCIIKEEYVKEAILKIEDKFSKFRNKVSMVYTIPLSSVIGVSTYMMLANGGKR